jgi:hypothetical protein
MNKVLRNIGVMLLFLLTVLVSQAQEIKIKAELDSSVILIGDQVNLNLQIEYPAQIDIMFPVPADTLGNTVEIIDRTPIDTLLNSSEKKILSQNFIVTSFDTGYHEIPPFLFGFKYNDMVDSVESNPTALMVYTIPKLDSLMAAIGGPIDIKPPYEAPVTLKEIAPWILGFLLLAGLIFLVAYAIKRKKNNQPLFSLPQKPKEPAHIIALRELDRIKNEKIWQKGQVKQFYSELTDTLREYIENRFGINALEQTSDETIAAFAYRRDLLDEKLYINLKKLLKNADLVKFAKFEPLPDDNNLAMVDAYFFVNQTKLEIKQELKNDREETDGQDVELR